MSKKLGELLLKDKIITPALFQEGSNAAQSGRSFVRHLIEGKHISETKLLYYLSQKFSLPTVSLDKFEIKPEVIATIKRDIVRKIQAIPIQMNAGTLVVALCDPTHLQDVQGLKLQLKMNIEAVLTTYSSFDRAIEKYYGGTGTLGATIETLQQKGELTRVSSAEIELVEVHDIETKSGADDAPAISVVNGILTEAIRRAASDIHIEPYEHRFRARLRVDGVLQELTEIPLAMKRSVVARLKIMSRMDIAESRIPQDGRIKLKYGGRDVDFRVSTLPTLFGEKVVLRMLDRGSLKLDLNALGFEPGQLQTFKKGIHSTNGMVLVTGPTGSGKTTTLYSSLLELNKVTDNISTVEDPVEYNLPGINQVQVNKDIGLGFTEVLKTFLRQDPDIILLGEIRDKDTAEVAIQAALTGHLVLSTIHTNDAPSTLTRLTNMGVEPFLLVASINTIVAQRLLRKLCPTCRAPTRLAPERLTQLGMTAALAQAARIFQATGCPQCGHTGYKGRVAVYEVLDFTTELKEALMRGATGIEMRKLAVAAGMRPLRQAGLEKAAAGETTIEEAVTNTMEG